jgi:hypothetical protein
VNLMRRIQAYVAYTLVFSFLLTGFYREARADGVGITDESVRRILAQYNITGPISTSLDGITNSTSGQLAIATGKGAISHLVGPSDQSLGIAAGTGKAVALSPFVTINGTTVTTNTTPPLSITQTWNEGSTVFTGLKVNITNTSSSLSSKPIDIQVGGSSIFNLNMLGTATVTGDLVAGTNVYCGGSSEFIAIAGSKLKSSADGSWLMRNSAGTGFTSLQLGGTTSSFPSIKRNSAAIDFRLADDSAYCNINGAAATLSGKITTYNGTTTAGMGVPIIVASGRATAQTAAVASVCTFTPAADGSFDVSTNLLITTDGSQLFTVQVTYTDEGNTSRTVELPFMADSGGSTEQIGYRVQGGYGAKPQRGIPSRIRAKGGTAITVKTQSGGTFSGCTYNVEGTITQVN